MHPELKKGIQVSSIIYGFCFCIAFIMYFKVDHTYMHAPAPYQGVLILLFYAAIIGLLFRCYYIS